MVVSLVCLFVYAGMRGGLKGFTQGKSSGNFTVRRLWRCHRVSAEAHRIPLPSGNGSLRCFGPLPQAEWPKPAKQSIAYGQRIERSPP